MRSEIRRDRGVNAEYETPGPVQPESLQWMELSLIEMVKIF